jgi:hypothetical protein
MVFLIYKKSCNGWMDGWMDGWMMINNDGKRKRTSLKKYTISGEWTGEPDHERVRERGNRVQRHHETR